MKKWILKKDAESFDDLVMQETSIPEPQKGEVRVKVYAVSLNYRDIAMAQGGMGLRLLRDIIPACDGAGEIDAVGEGVEGWSIGDKVISQYYKEWTDGTIIPGLGIGLGSDESDGMLAEYVILSAGQIIRAPNSLTYSEASTLPCAGLTVWSALNGNRPYLTPLKKNEKVLVLGTGNIAIMTISIAKGLGAEVYCTTSQDSKIETLKSMGVKEVVNYKKHSNWGEILFNMTGGIELVVNSAGAASLNESFKALSYGGRMALVGAMDVTDRLPELLFMIYKNLTMYGVLAGSTAAFKDLNSFMDTQEVKPYIYKTYGFEDVKEAYRVASSGEALGKVVIELNQ